MYNVHQDAIILFIEDISHHSVVIILFSLNFAQIIRYYYKY